MPTKNKESGLLLGELAAMLGIPRDEATFDSRALHVVWVGSGTKCAEIVSAVEKKALEAGFIKSQPKKNDDDPVVESALSKFRDPSESHRDYVFRKPGAMMKSTVLMQHNLGVSSDEDTASILLYVEDI